MAHHFLHHRAAVDDIAFTWATGFRHFSHLLKVSEMMKGAGFLGRLVICFSGLHGRYHLLSDCIDGSDKGKDTPLRYYFEFRDDFSWVGGKANR